MFTAEVNGQTPTYSSCVQLEGLSMRCPSFSNLKSSSTGMPGYGEPPSVKISHMRTPNDHLRRDASESMRLLKSAVLEMFFLQAHAKLHLHVTLVCVDSVKQGFRCHPFHWQPSLQGTPHISHIFNHHTLSWCVFQPSCTSLCWPPPPSPPCLSQPFSN